jgi:L-alanine-DL-glutamate epimerase-like enolase superfamily enzyme
MVTQHAPMAEDWDVDAGGGEQVFINERTIKGGHIMFNERPGSGSELKPKVLAQNPLCSGKIKLLHALSQLTFCH